MIYETLNFPLPDIITFIIPDNPKTPITNQINNNKANVDKKSDIIIPLTHRNLNPPSPRSLILQKTNPTITILYKLHYQIHLSIAHKNIIIIIITIIIICMLKNTSRDIFGILK